MSTIQSKVSKRRRIESTPETNPFISVFKNVILERVKHVKKRDAWEDSEWKDITRMEKDDVGKIGEQTIHQLCVACSIPSMIDGLKTKVLLSGGYGDGTIHGKSVEIKTARMGSASTKTFQHEFGVYPWNPEYVLFLDITPSSLYITLFPNKDEQFWRNSANDKSIKFTPYFPTKSVTQRALQGAFKLDTTVKINEDNVSAGRCFKIDNVTPQTIDSFREYINRVMSL